MFNPALGQLTDFTFRRLAELLEPVPSPAGLEPIDLSIGSPMHPVPELLTETLARHGHLWNRYPPVDGTPAFRQAAVGWLRRRYGLPEGALDPDRHILPVAGTKEALFLIAQLMSGGSSTSGPGRPAVLMPNPFYNVYLGAALFAGAEPVLLPVDAPSGHLPRLDDLAPELLDRTSLFYLCTPANPQGAVADLDYLTRAVDLARRHHFLLVVDECYSEIYTRDPPVGALQAALAAGSFDRLMVFHSLSKRSSAAGLRAGFVAGDPAVIRAFRQLRSYGAAVQPLPVLAAASALLDDEDHVQDNRRRYQEKHALAEDRLCDRFPYRRPQGGFFVWLSVEDGEAASRRLWSEAALKVLPGAYLGRPDDHGRNPGRDWIRLALVQDRTLTAEALDRLMGVLG